MWRRQWQIKDVRGGSGCEGKDFGWRKREKRRWERGNAEAEADEEDGRVGVCASNQYRAMAMGGPFTGLQFGCSWAQFLPTAPRIHSAVFCATLEYPSPSSNHFIYYYYYSHVSTQV